VGRSPSYHQPVLTDRVVAWLEGLDGGVILDATHGGGGHTAAILSALPHSRVVALDRDPDARPDGAEARVSFHLADFRSLDEALEQEGVDDLAGAVFDLGVSSHQLDVGERGFSYRTPGPLDMRMGPDAAFTAADVVNHWDEQDIVRIIREYGEEHFAGPGTGPTLPAERSKRFASPSTTSWRHLPMVSMSPCGCCDLEAGSS
jgi:16S rRNA (cytosine1402-N4)-methyltransferase